MTSSTPGQEPQAPYGCSVCEAPPGIRHLGGCPNIGEDSVELAYPDPWGGDKEEAPLL